MTYPLAKEIAHLSLAQVEELYARYLAGEKNIALIQEFKINVHQNKLLSLFPPIVHNDSPCPYCHVFMYSERRGKNDRKWWVPVKKCPTCAHSIYNTNSPRRAQICNCNNCLTQVHKEKEKLSIEQRAIIDAEYSIDKIQPVEYEALGFREKFFLFPMLRFQTNESLDYICSFSEAYSNKAPFAATDDFRYKVIRELYEASIIAVSKFSPVSAFKEGSNFKTFFLDYVRWIPNVSINGVRLEVDRLYGFIYADFQALTDYCSINDIESVMCELAQDEVFQYLQVRCGELGVDFAPEKKTREVVVQLLNDFSVSEIYYFAKKSVENAHLFYEKGHANNKKHAANTIPGKMQGLGERALAEGWSLNKYSRDSRAPQSALNKILYGFILKDEDSGFYKSPAKNIEELKMGAFAPSSKKPSSDLFCSSCESLNVQMRRLDESIVLFCMDCGINEKFILNKPSS